MRFAVLPVVGLLLAPTLAMAQQATPATPAAPAPSAPASTANAAPSASGLQDQISADLKKAGYSDVQVTPDSFVVQAKDKAGNPVAMFITGTSLTEVVDVANTAPGQANTGNTAFTTVPANDWMTSKIVGMDVKNDAKQTIGTVKDVVYTGRSIKAYIVGVGGFLGMGERYVAVKPSAMHITVNSDKTMHATLNANADQLKAAPEFKYPT